MNNSDFCLWFIWSATSTGVKERSPTPPLSLGCQTDIYCRRETKAAARFLIPPSTPPFQFVLKISEKSAAPSTRWSIALLQIRVVSDRWGRFTGANVRQAVREEESESCRKYGSWTPGNTEGRALSHRKSLSVKQPIRRPDVGPDLTFDLADCVSGGFWSLFWRYHRKSSNFLYETFSSCFMWFLSHFNIKTWSSQVWKNAKHHHVTLLTTLWIMWKSLRGLPDPTTCADLGNKLKKLQENSFIFIKIKTRCNYKLYLNQSKTDWRNKTSRV